MKKTELKELVRKIVFETIDQKRFISESNTLFGFQKSKCKKENTYTKKDNKTITSTPTPIEKKESKKLPIKDNTVNTEIDHIIDNKNTPSIFLGKKSEEKSRPIGGHNALKEDIINMIQEAITAYKVEEMSRIKGAIGSKYKIKDTISPTGWVVKGHPTIPDGTPIDAPKGTYIPKGTYGTNHSDGNKADAVIDVYFNGELQDFNFLKNTWPTTRAWIESNIMSELGDATLTAKIGQSVYNKIESEKELDLSGKLDTSNNQVELYYNKQTNTLEAR